MVSFCVLLRLQKHHTRQVKIEGTGSTKSWFRIRRHTKLSKVFGVFCQMFSLERDSCAFEFDAHELTGTETAEELDLQVRPPGASDLDFLFKFEPLLYRLSPRHASFHL